MLRTSILLLYFAVKITLQGFSGNQYQILLANNNNSPGSACITPDSFMIVYGLEELWHRKFQSQTSFIQLSSPQNVQQILKCYCQSNTYHLLIRANEFDLYNKQINGTINKLGNIYLNGASDGIITKDSRLMVGTSSSQNYAIVLSPTGTGAFWFLQALFQPTSPLLSVCIGNNESSLFLGAQDQSIWFYKRIFNPTGNDSYIFEGSLTVNMPPSIMKASDDGRFLFAAGTQSFVQIYENVSSNFTFHSQIALPGIVLGLQINVDLSYIMIYGKFDVIKIYAFDQTSNAFSLQQQLVIIGVSSIYSAAFDSAKNFIVIASDIDIRVYFLCLVSNCEHCSFINICSTCKIGFSQLNGECIIGQTVTNIPPIVQITYHNYCKNGLSINNTAVCFDYCKPQCQTCSEQRCLTCSQLYFLTQNGSCVIKETSLSVGSSINSVFTMISMRKLKFLLMFASDMFLYQYHKYSYAGTINGILQMSRYAQKVKYELIEEKLFPYIQYIQEMIPKFDQYANEKFLVLQRKDDSMPRNLVAFIVQSAPITIGLFLMLKIIFHLLSGYKISKYLRLFSFNGFLLVMLFEENIQYFTFFAFRHFQLPFAECFIKKVYAIASLCLYLIVFVTAICSYYLLSYLYQKLAKYFLDNLYRISGSFFLMNILYGIRPILQGIVHSLLFQHVGWQLTLLSLIDICIIALFIVLQMWKGLFKSQVAFSCNTISLFLSVLVNLLLWMNLQSQQEQDRLLFEIIDQATFFTVLIKLGINLVGIIFNFLEIIPKSEAKNNQQTNRQLTQSDQEQKKSKIQIKIIGNQIVLQDQKNKQMEKDSNHQYSYCKLFKHNQGGKLMYFTQQSSQNFHVPEE